MHDLLPCGTRLLVSDMMLCDCTLTLVPIERSRLKTVIRPRHCKLQ
jgi:hypothetical protein